MENVIEYLEAKPETDLLKRVKDFLKQQEFIRQHLRNDGSFEELKQMGIEFGKVDLSGLSKSVT